jgi:hypothetical protein
VASKYRRLNPERLAAARAEFDSMEKQQLVFTVAHGEESGQNLEALQRL